MEGSGQGAKRILVIDDDRDVGDLIYAVLTDEGFAVTSLFEPSFDDQLAAIERLEPDCVILDSGGADYEDAWAVARNLAARRPPVPTLILTGVIAALEEAMLDVSDRSRAAHFAGLIPKPFDIEQLLTAVHNAVGLPLPGASTERETARAAELVESLRASGARDLRTSASGREWVTFRAHERTELYKVYRWRAADLYFIGRYSADGTQLAPLGLFHDLEAVIAYCRGVLRPDI